ncbi:MAG: hypothetical protein NVSMB17_16150 [Candidatus Dormibacteria bacterium]
MGDGVGATIATATPGAGLGEEPGDEEGAAEAEGAGAGEGVMDGAGDGRGSEAAWTGAENNTLPLSSTFTVGVLLEPRSKLADQAATGDAPAASRGDARKSVIDPTRPGASVTR